MQGISSFLDKFKNFVPRDKALKKELIRIVEKYAHVTIEPTQIQVKGFVAYLDVSPQAKSEIFLYRESILEELTRVLPATDVKNIL